MSIKFIKLNENWNAEPNAPEESVSLDGSNVILEFTLNPWALDGFEEEERAKIVFKNCFKYRLGPTNDEGWYLGQCRFGKLAPEWGEFYKVEGDLHLEKCPNDWRVIADEKINSSHFLFYFRDEEFECDAENWEFKLK